MADIEVVATGAGAYAVRVTDDGSTSEHTVTLDEADRLRLAGGFDRAEDFVRACFEFLLAREPREQILREFDVSVIPRYFPEFEEEIRKG